MKSHSEVALFSQHELALLRQATHLVESLPDRVEGRYSVWTKDEGDQEDLPRCHELARAIGKILHLPCEDGRYGIISHAWLWTRPLIPSKEVRPSPNILDVFCVGRLPMVQLVDYIACALPHRSAYTFPHPREDIDESLVDLFVELMQQTGT